MSNAKKVIKAGKKWLVSMDKSVRDKCRILVSDHGQRPLAEYLEPRQLLSGTVYMVNTLNNNVANDGYLSFAEAVIASSSNTPFNEAAAGSGTDIDQIAFSDSLFTNGPVTMNIYGNGSTQHINDSLLIRSDDTNKLTLSFYNMPINVQAGKTLIFENITVQGNTDYTVQGNLVGRNATFSLPVCTSYGDRSVITVTGGGSMDWQGGRLEGPGQITVQNLAKFDVKGTQFTSLGRWNNDYNFIGGSMNVEYQIGSMGKMFSNSGELSVFLNFASDVMVKGNNFANLEQIYLTGDASSTIDLSDNYWGTTIDSDIEARITHHTDDSSLPTAVWNPIRLLDPATPFSLIGAKPSPYINSQTTNIDLFFSHAINTDTVSINDFVMVGTDGNYVPLTDMNIISENSVRLQFDPLSISGVYSIQITGDIRNLLNNPLVSDTYTPEIKVTADVMAPFITQINRNSDNPGVLNAFDINFSEDIDPNSFGVGDIILRTPSGDRIDDLIIHKLTGNAYRVSFQEQTLPGLYTIEVLPIITDIAGNTMDYNHDGNGEVVESYKSSLNVVNVDLAVTDLMVTGEPDIQSGAKLTILWHDQNNGLSVAENAWDDQITIVNSDTGETLLNTTVHHDPLLNGSVAPDSSVINSIDFVLPNGMRGTGDIIVNVTVDANRVVSEVNPEGTAESNNTTALTVNSSLAPYPDVFVGNPVVPAEINAGKQTSISWTIENAGNAPTNGSWTERIYLSSDSEMSSDDIYLKSVVLSDLLVPGQVKEQSTYINIPYAISGDRYVLITASSNTGQYEPDNDNNTGASEIPIRILAPDLSISAVNTQDTAVSGEQLRVSWSIANIGTGTMMGPLSERIYLSPDPYLSGDDIFLKSVQLSDNLASGAAVDQTALIDVPYTIFGDQYVLITVSSDTGQYEPDTINNTCASEESLHIRVPDLLVNSVVTQDTAILGEQIQVTWTVTNTGEVAAKGPWTDRIYLSTDGGVNNAISLGSFTHEELLEVGSSYTQTSYFKVPTVTGLYKVIVITDALGTILESSESTNVASSLSNVIIKAPYKATVHTDMTSVPNGTPIVISGHAYLTTEESTPAANSKITVRILTQNTRRILSVTTDANGDFSTTFTPLQFEAGHYSIAADHPAVGSDIVQDEFEIFGMESSVSNGSIRLVPGSPTTGYVDIKNLGDVVLTGLKASIEGLPNTVVASVKTPDSIAGDGTGRIEYTLDAQNALNSHGIVRLHISTTEGATLDVPIEISVVPITSQLSCSPGFLTSGIVRGTQTVFNLNIANNGGAASGDLQISLPDFPWLKTSAGNCIKSIQAGGNAILTIIATPPDDLDLGRYTGSIAVQGIDGGFTIGFNLTVTSEAVGDVSVSVSDDYTYYAQGAPMVEGAKVVLLDSYDNSIVIAESVTDNVGNTVFTGIHEGTYLMKVSAQNHGTYNSTIKVSPGIVNKADVFIARETVTYSWKVVPTTVTDVYETKLVSTFDTDVPVPVLTLEMPEVLPLMDPGESAQIDIVFTNHGLVAANNLELELPDSAEFSFSALTNKIGIIAANSSVIIPVTVTRKISSEPQSASEVAEIVRLSTKSNSSSSCSQIIFSALYGYMCGPELVWKRVLGSVMTGLACSSKIPASIPSPGGWAPVVTESVPVIYDWNPTPSQNTQWVPSNWSTIVNDYSPTGAFTPPSVVMDNPCNTCNPFTYKISASNGILQTALEKLEEKMMSAIPYLEVKDLSSKIGGQLSFSRCCNGSSESGWMCEASASLEANINCFIGLGPESLEYDNVPVDEFGSTVDLNFDAGLGFFPEATITINGTATSDCNLQNWNFCTSGTISLTGFLGGKLNASAAYHSFTGETYGGSADVNIGLKTGANGNLSFCTDDGFSGNICWDGLDVGYDASVKIEIPDAEDNDIIKFNKHVLIFNKSCLYDQPQTSAKSMLREESSNSEKESEFMEELEGIITPEELALGLGYDSIDDMNEHLNLLVSGDQYLLDSTTILSILNKQAYIDSLGQQGVCAQVKIGIDQDAVMTRNAFQGTLEIDNNSSAGSIQGVQVDLDITDENGNPANDKFGITDPILTGLSGVKGEGVIQSGEIGTAVYTFMPTHDAAPVKPTIYHIGGTLKYIAPDSGQEITVQLYPSTITVYPDALLELDYFQQRDVIGDDPFTDQIEASEPFTLGLLVHNVGNGEAQDLTITSAQPAIIENKKGLLSDFQIVGTQIWDQSVSPSLTVDLGDIAPGKTQEARWLLTSSLQGRFTDFSATYEHITGLGDPRLSLISSVNVHELIHTVRADRPGDDSGYDFLVNDDKDVNVFPDMLYMSDGTTAVVNVAGAASADHSASIGNLQVHLTAEMTSGWCYLRMADPGANYKLARVVRSDGTEINVGENAWQTDRVFAETDQSFHEEARLNLLDYDSTGSYTLYYVLDDSVPPEVKSIAQVTPNPAQGAIPFIDVTLSEEVDLSTFDYNDITLTLNGGDNLIDSSVTISHVSGATYRIGNLSALTGEDGNYSITVDARGIRDFGTNSGINSLTMNWVKGIEKPVVVSVGPLSSDVINTPVAFLDVEFSKEIEPASFDISDIVLKRNGVDVDISGSGVEQVNQNTFRIKDIGNSTTADGLYTLTVIGAGVADIDGNVGTGSLSISWTMDVTAPVAEGITHLATNPRNIVVPSIDITFSEAIDASTFDWHDLTLTRDGGSNLISNAVTVQCVSNTIYRISNFNWVSGQEGEYVFTVSGQGIRDIAGNIGSGQVSETWVMDTTKPMIPENLRISTGTGASSTDGLTNALSFSIQGDLYEAGLLVEVKDNTNNTLLAAQRMSDAVLNIPVTLTSSGRHDISLHLVDRAGNVTDTSLKIFIDQIAPTIKAFNGIPSVVTTTPLQSVDIVFSEIIDTSKLSINDFILTHDGNILDLSGAELVAIDGVTFHLQNLPVPASADGSYELAISLSGIADMAGNTGNGEIKTSWKVGDSDTISPTVISTEIQNNQGTANVSTFSITFSEAMNIQPMITDGSIARAVSLVRLDSSTHAVENIVALSAAQFSYNYATNTLSWNLNGSSGGNDALPSGLYEIQLDHGRFSDLSGNLLHGNGGGYALVGMPVFDTSVNMQAAGSDIQATAYSVPAMADWNSDGLQDLIVGEEIGTAGKIRVYLNTGTKDNPVFDNYFYVQANGADLTVASAGCLGVFPRMADWNNDGKKDLVLGLADGTLEVFMNTSASSTPEFGTPMPIQTGPIGQKTNINVGARATFDIADWNNDGLNDLVVGAADGKVRVYLNDGTPSAPSLEAGVIVQEGSSDLIVSSGRSSVSIIDLDHDGRKDLVLGNTEGQLVFYKNTGTDESPVFIGHELLMSDGAIIDLTGTPRSRQFMFDYNGDGIMDMLVGSQDGFVRLYEGHPSAENYVLTFQADSTVPISAVNALPKETTTESFLVEWSGNDDANGSGIANYDIYVSTDGGNFTLWKDKTTETSATFIGEFEHTYSFYSIARDNVGHVETKTVADTGTSLKDPKPQSIMVSASEISINEGQGSTFTVQLSKKPAADVTVTISRTSGDGSITTNLSTLTFTAQNWNAPQTVTLNTLADNNVADSSATFTISSADLDDQTLIVNAKDTDVQSLVVSESNLTMVEGEAATFGVSLAYKPSKPVTVTVSKSSGDAGLSANVSTLTFTAENWNISQQVTISSQLDMNLTDSSAVFTVSSQGLPDKTISVKSYDSDTTTMIVLPASLQINEGGSGTFFVRLTYKPDVNVTVSIVRTSGDGTITANAATLTFTQANWNIMQQVTVSAPADANSNDSSAVFKVSVPTYRSQQLAARQAQMGRLMNLPRVVEKTVTVTAQDAEVRTLAASSKSTPSFSKTFAAAELSSASSVSETSLMNNAATNAAGPGVVRKLKGLFGSLFAEPSQTAQASSKGDSGWNKYGSGLTGEGKVKDYLKTSHLTNSYGSDENSDSLKSKITFNAVESWSAVEIAKTKASKSSLSGLIKDETSLMGDAWDAAALSLMSHSAYKPAEPMAVTQEMLDEWGSDRKKTSNNKKKFRFV